MRRMGLLSLLAVFAGCPGPAGPVDPVAGVNPDGTPRWITRGSGAYDGEHGKAFYGVGIVTGIRNQALARQTADNRARGEIAKIFDLYVAAMMKDYQRSTTAGDFQASAEEQDVVSAQKTITEVTLRGVEVRDHWVDPSNGALYALAMLEPAKIGQNLGDTNLPARIRDYVRDNARRAFEDLDKELGKRSERQEATPAPPPPPEPEAEAAPAPPPPPPPKATAPKGSPKVGLKITGMDRATVQSCFAERLIAAGFQLFEGTSDVDFMISGELTHQRAGVFDNAVMVNARMNLRVHSMHDARTRVALAERVRVGRPDINQSIQLATSRLCELIVPKAVDKIRAAVR